MASSKESTRMKKRQNEQTEAERDGDGIPAVEAEDVRPVCLAQVFLW